MESFLRQRSNSSRTVRACDRVSANSMSFEDFFCCLKEATGQDYQRSDVEDFFNEASCLQSIYSFIPNHQTTREGLCLYMIRVDISFINFFVQMSISCDGRVEWHTFQTFMLQHYKHITQSMQPCQNLPISHPLIRKCTYNKVTANSFSFTSQPCVHFMFLSQSHNNVITYFVYHSFLFQKLNAIF